ncbi:MAG: DUF4255 domain-containing protein [Bacteroidota bacterium]
MNLFNAIKFIETKLEDYFTDEADHVIIANIADEDHVKEKIIITMVNLEEEKTMKNQKYVKMNALQKPVYQNPPVNVNLFLLFTATHDNYETALKHLSRVVEFFQGKNVFSNKDGNLPNGSNESFKLILDLIPMSFEGTNHLWGFLGGKQLPSVIYKMRMVSLEAGKPTNIGGTIFESDITSTKIEGS